MNDVAIRVESLGKMYRIGAAAEEPDGLWGAVKGAVGSPFAYLRRMARPPTEAETLWALRDVSFEVKRGEVVGIIGRNGAGKTTLLKILARITEPTEGRAEIHGRVGSLLEVGTGFHPELTGRENIYLSGAILGMRKAEIDGKFDEIVDFSGVARFLDTPVKRYSSGMYVRLAFAVAAHLEPEILLVDEVLAVGDAEFQQKCLGKMSSVAKEGRTVLFVSHNMNAVSSLCSEVVLLDRGQVTSSGPARIQVARHLLTLPRAFAPNAVEVEDRTDVSVLVKDVCIQAENGEERYAFDMVEPITIKVTVAQNRLEKPLRLVIRIRSLPDSLVVLASTDWDLGHPIGYLEAGEYTAICLIPGNLLNTGRYSLSVGIDAPRGPIHFLADNVAVFAIVNSSSFGEGLFGERDGILSPYREWKFISSHLPQDGNEFHD